MLTRTQFYVAVADAVDAETVDLGVQAFFKSYLAFPVVILFYIVGWVWKREGWRRISEIDVDSGRRELDYDSFQKLKAKRAGWPAWRRTLDKFV